MNANLVANAADKILSNEARYFRFNPRITRPSHSSYTFRYPYGLIQSTRKAATILCVNTANEDDETAFWWDVEACSLVVQRRFRGA